MSALSADLFSRYAATYPRTVSPLRGPVAALNVTAKARPLWPANARGWFGDPHLDVTTAPGIAVFSARLLGWSSYAVAEIQRVGASSAIIWDIEGQQFDSSYVGDPSIADTIAPELGNGLLDGFVSTFTSAGIAIGFTIRPQAFRIADHSQDGSVDPESVLAGKVQYCISRWGASLFYVDSGRTGTVATLAQVYQNLSARFPSATFFPEWHNVRHHAYTIPYGDARSKYFGPTPRTLAIYPEAIGMIHVNDQAAQQFAPQLTAAAQRGNILLFDGWYRHAANDFVKGVYAAIG